MKITTPTRCLTTFALVAILLGACKGERESALGDLIPEHVQSSDVEYLDAAFLHGYTHNLVFEKANGDSLPTLTIQCTSESKHREGPDLDPHREFFSVWTRDLYWGFLGWVQAGDDRVTEMMKSSILLLIAAKERNQCLGQAELWPLNDGRYYVPQAYTTGLEPALALYPWCSESQADFLLLCHDYWEQTGDLEFIASIWPEIAYVTETLELLDTDGNSLPDALQGSYDYMWIKENSEEPLMCAKTSMAFGSVATLAAELGHTACAERLTGLAGRIRRTMNLPVESGGLWKEGEEGGHYIQMRSLDPVRDSIHDRFIPYNNLVPMWCGMTGPGQDVKIFQQLDASFGEIYELEYGPMYCAPAGKNERSVMDCSSVTWLAFLDIYLRGKKDYPAGRDRIYRLLVEHMHDAGGTPFPEGAGVYGYLTGGAGRSWDNGNFFHMLICGICGIRKDREGIHISGPHPLQSLPLSELDNVKWQKATYDFTWEGDGEDIREVLLDGKPVPRSGETWLLDASKGNHRVTIKL